MPIWGAAEVRTNHGRPPTVSRGAVSRGVGSRSGAGIPWLGLVALGLLGAVGAYLANLPCRLAGWRGGVQYTHGCYTDIHPLFFRDGLDQGTLVYVEQPVEYPVLIGAWMQAAATAVSWIPDPRAAGLAYYDLTAIALTVCLVATVVMVGLLVGRGAGWTRGAPGSPGSQGTPSTRFDTTAALVAGAAVALTPAGVLTAFINWDLLAVALATAALVLWQGRDGRCDRPWLTGVLLGLAVAAKFYPLFFLGPLLVLGVRAWWRERDGGETLRSVARVAGGAVLAWAAVNLPVLLASPTGWATFFTYSSERGADWGTGYYLLAQAGAEWAGGGETLNAVGTLGFLLACAAVGALGLFARRRPPLAALVFLTVAAFILTNKVWSPQFVLWLIPLAVLAWPRTLSVRTVAVSFVLWQVGELGYSLGIWPYLGQFVLDPGEAPAVVTLGGYAVLTLGRLSGLILMCAVVCVGCLRRPSHPVTAGSLRAD